MSFVSHHSSVLRTTGMHMSVENNMFHFLCQTMQHIIFYTLMFMPVVLAILTRNALQSIPKQYDIGLLILVTV